MTRNEIGGVMSWLLLCLGMFVVSGGYLWFLLGGGMSIAVAMIIVAVGLGLAFAGAFTPSE